MRGFLINRNLTVTDIWRSKVESEDRHVMDVSQTSERE
jgi:hypothetical protein